jgi:hypothetical protein
VKGAHPKAPRATWRRVVRKSRRNGGQGDGSAAILAAGGAEDASLPGWQEILGRLKAEMGRADRASERVKPDGREEVFPDDGSG